MVMGACLCLFHGSPPGIVAHLLEPLPPAILERNLGVPGCKVCRIRVGADEPLQWGPFQVCPCMKNRSGISSSPSQSLTCLVFPAYPNL